RIRRFLGPFLVSSACPRPRGAKPESPAENHLEDQMLSAMRDPHSDSGIELPIRPKIQVKCRYNLLLLIAKRIKTGHRSESAVIFQSNINAARQIITGLEI